MYLSEQGEGKRREQDQAGAESTSDFGSVKVGFFVLMQ